jgi:hypothetical protein
MGRKSDQFYLNYLAEKYQITSISLDDVAFLPLPIISNDLLLTLEKVTTILNMRTICCHMLGKNYLRLWSKHLTFNLGIPADIRENLDYWRFQREITRLKKFKENNHKKDTYSAWLAERNENVYAMIQIHKVPKT